jgi:hypothetical protein
MRWKGRLLDKDLRQRRGEGQRIVIRKESSGRVVQDQKKHNLCIEDRVHSIGRCQSELCDSETLEILRAVFKGTVSRDGYLF